MKRQLVLLTIILLLTGAGLLNAQIPDFTRLDTCRITQDLGNSQGSALADIDGDGDIDLLIGNNSGFGELSPALLYKNERKGNFSRILTGDLATFFGPEGNPTASLADVDNDGDWDACLPCIFFKNDGYGEFTMEYLDPQSGEGCGDQVVSWVDINHDGHLDFSIWRQMLSNNSLYLSNGDGTYSEVSDDPFVNTPSNTEALSWADFDNDGDMDVFCSELSFTGPGYAQNWNACFTNDGGTFSEMNNTHSLLQDHTGSVGASWGDYDNDGFLDLYVVNARSTNHLYHNDGSGEFTQLTIDPEGAFDKGFTGSDWGDFDNDGDLDLIVSAEQNDLGDMLFAHYNMLFQNNGDGTFTEVASGNLKTDGGHSCTLLDHDNDGDLDILMPNGSLGSPFINYIYSNEGNENNWINVTCIGTTSNKSAIGARIYVKTTIFGEEVRQMRELAQQTGIHSFSSPRFHFGLGDAKSIDSLIIRWPSGTVDSYTDVRANQFMHAIENNTLKPNFGAYNYIEYGPVCETLSLMKYQDTTLNLADHFRLVTGDTVPDGAGESVSFMLFEDEDPDLVTASLNGSTLAIQSDKTEGTAAVKIKSSADKFRDRIDFILVTVEGSTGMDAVTAACNVSVYPNPATSMLTVEFSHVLSGTTSIEIYDLSGKLCFAECIKGSNSLTHALDLEGIKTGAYFIRIMNAEFLHTEKLVKID